MNRVVFRVKVIDGEKHMDMLLRNHEILAEMFGSHRKNVPNDEQVNVDEYVQKVLEQDFGYIPDPNTHASKAKWLKTDWYTYCRVTLRIAIGDTPYKSQWYEFIYNFYDEYDAIQFKLMTS